jgi:hypothetical protein
MGTTIATAHITFPHFHNDGKDFYLRKNADSSFLTICDALKVLLYRLSGRRKSHPIVAIASAKIIDFNEVRSRGAE